MFEYVSNAHYFWELMSWIVFGLITQTATSYMFALFSFTSMITLAKDKHDQYKKYFIDYPKNRAVMIPFLI